MKSPHLGRFRGVEGKRMSLKNGIVRNMSYNKSCAIGLPGGDKEV